jgi:phage shock protein A
MTIRGNSGATCFRHALPRGALTRREKDTLEDQLETAREATGAMKRQLDGMKAKLAEGKRNLATLSARKRAADFRKKMETQAAGATVDVDDNAFSKFDRLKSKVEQAEAEAMAELRGSDPSPILGDEDTPDEDLDVAAELADLKKKVKE